MSRTFVAIGDPVHRLLRNLTQRTPLTVTSNDGVTSQVTYDINAHQVPETYFSLALLHGLGGMDVKRSMSAQASFGLKHRVQILEQANYFDVRRLDRRCSRDIRLKPSGSGPVMLSGETLCHGVGALRATNDDLHERSHRELIEEHGRLCTSRQKSFALIRALHGRDSDVNTAPGRDSYESTNVIYGDVLGEIEQLWERRADVKFLDAVAQTLANFKSNASPSAGANPPRNVPDIVNLHLERQALWRTPPRSGRTLLKRIEFILSNTSVDNWPKTEFLPTEQKTSEDSGNSGPGFDGSGYDGWLP